MKILIVGSSGFLGKSLRKYLSYEKFEIYTLSRNGESDFNFDISEFESFNVLPLNFFEVIINCATILPGLHYLNSQYLDSIYNTNIKGTQNICKWINGQRSITQILNCSSLSIYKRPLFGNSKEDSYIYPTGNHVLYSSSKLMQELIFETFAKEKEINLCQFRFSALYGKGMAQNGILYNLINQAKHLDEICIHNGDNVSFDFLNVKNASEIIISAIKNNYNGILNAASGKEIYLMELAKIILSKIDKSKQIVNTNIIGYSDRMNINIDKLQEIVDSSYFIEITTGLDELID